MTSSRPSSWVLTIVYIVAQGRVRHRSPLRFRRLTAKYMMIVILFATISVAVIAQGKYCGSKESNVYHYPSCRYVQQIKPENLIWFKDEYEAVAKGYRPCKVCNPPLPGQTTTTTTATKTTTYTSIVTPSTSWSWPSTTTVTSRTSTPYSTATTTAASSPSPTISYSTYQTWSTLSSTATTVSPFSTHSPVTTEVMSTVASTVTTLGSSATTVTQASVGDYTTLVTGLSLGILVSLIGLGISRTRRRIKTR